MVNTLFLLVVFAVQLVLLNYFTSPIENFYGFTAAVPPCLLHGLIFLSTSEAVLLPRASYTCSPTATSAVLQPSVAAPVGRVRVFVHRITSPGRFLLESFAVLLVFVVSLYLLPREILTVACLGAVVQANVSAGAAVVQVAAGQELVMLSAFVRPSHGRAWGGATTVSVWPVVGSAP